ncbi:murein transglycosylase [Frankia sp. Cr2]|uniref:lytic transglycosylase domain-containing protein n=1 Tax=Frankia sp. Cr2 TaxID=3073932 RepID=UPI002AD3169D|nr:murein transglycosylase [Frankia sp. Cr2]
MPRLAASGGSGTSGGDGPTPSTQSLAVAAATGTGVVVTLGTGDKGIPDRVLAAYQKAAQRTARERPGCQLAWPLLAGIGKVESGHAAGRSISADGTITPSIIGLPLDGNDGRALILDTDGGNWDGDTFFDRAVGPMQFIPSTWQGSGRDGNDDGQRNPNNIDDAALATAGYLCAYNRNLTDPTQLWAAVFAYNPSDDYVRAVLAWTTGYSDSGVIALPTSATAGTPAPGGGPTPVPTITVTSQPQAAGTPMPTPSTACPVITVGTATLTATPTNLDDGVPGYEALDIAGVLTATTTTPVTAPVTAAVNATLSDSHGWTITSVRTVVTADAPGAVTPRQLARFDGTAIGEAGADGALTVTLTPELDAAGCAAAPPTTFDVGGLNAADFAGWATTPARLHARLADYAQLGQVEPATADALGALIPASVTGPGALTPFLDRLGSATPAQVHDEARTRLTSIAQRLNSQQTQGTPPPAPTAAPAPTATTTPAGTPAPTATPVPAPSPTPTPAPASTTPAPPAPAPTPASAATAAGAASAAPAPSPTPTPAPAQTQTQTTPASPATSPPA